MLRSLARSTPARTLLYGIAVSLLVLGQCYAPRAGADELVPRSLTVSDSLGAAHNVTYKVSVGIATTAIVGSIRIQLCSNTALVDDSCVAPFGFDASSTTLATQAGATGFALSTSSTANELILTRPPAIQAPVTATYEFPNITNPSNEGSYYARVLTYASSNASGPYIDAGGLAFAINPSLGVSAEVPPYLTFCVGETITNFDCTTATEAFSDLGDLAPNLTSAATAQMMVATNASNGYSAWVMGNTMTSGNNVIAAMTGQTVQKGVAQFGLNLRANASPNIGADPTGPGVGAVAAGYNQSNHYRFATGDTVVTSPAPDNFRKYTISYVVNVPPDQPGGVYSTTLTYVCLANF
jgi:hypothetical protein